MQSKNLVLNELPVFLSIPRSKECSYLNWDYQCVVASPLHVVNLYRKVFMSQLGVYKMQVIQFESSDPFIVREFLETRMMQIPISQDNLDDEFVIDIKNTISQEMSVTTDHIRWTSDGSSQSARKARRLCGYAHLCKLDAGKHLYMKLRKCTNTPIYHDVFRAGTFIAIEAPEEKKHQEESKLELTHIRERSLCKIQMFGSISPYMFKTNAYCSRAFQQLIDEGLKHLTVYSKGNELVINLQAFPEYIVDPIMCEMIADLRSNFKQIIPKGTNLILVSDQSIQEDDINNYGDMTRQTIQELSAKLQSLETLITKDIPSV